MEVGATITKLTALNVASLGAGELSAATRDIARVRGFLDELEARVARRAGDLHAAGSGVPAEDLLARGGRTSRRAAERTRKRAEALGDAPEMGAALSKGRISPEHADALAAVAERVGDEQRGDLFDHDRELAEAAAAKTPEQFRRFLNRLADALGADCDVEHAERQRASATLSMGIDETTGMHWLRGQFAPEHGIRLRRLLDGAVDRLAKQPDDVGRRRDQLAAAALIDLVTGARATIPRHRTELAVLIDIDTLSSGRHIDTLSEYSNGSSLPVEMARRLACDANIIPVVLNGDGMPLDVGRSQRLATTEQRTALRAMYRTCGVGDCDVDFDRCEIHHLVEWDANGPTDLDNLVPICSRDHHRAHEGRWRLELDATNRALTVWLPDGTLHSRSFPDIIQQRNERTTRGHPNAA